MEVLCRIGSGLWTSYCVGNVGRKEHLESAKENRICTERLSQQPVRSREVRFTRASKLLSGEMPSGTRPLEWIMGGLEQTNFWMLSLERTLWKLEQTKFWMRPLERATHRSSEPDAACNFEFEREKGVLREFLEGWKTRIHLRTSNLRLYIWNLNCPSSSGAPKIN